MSKVLPLQDSEKLFVTYRVEPGCLGPEGADHISKFCDFAQLELRTLDSDYVVWNIVPRIDKELPEMEYSIVGKRMIFSQAEKYLALFDKSLDKFEGNLSDRLAALIDKFMEY